MALMEVANVRSGTIRAAMVSHRLPLPAAAPSTVGFDATLLPSCCPTSSCYQIRPWRPFASMHCVRCKISPRSRLEHCGMWGIPCGISESKGKSLKKNAKIITAELPTAAIGAATGLAIGGAIFALTKLNRDSPIIQSKKQCEACGGSGICPTCNGEGFVNKNLTPEAAAKARARAKDAATRYTAGLAKKWNYCSDCAGQRGCRSCEGRGWVQ